MKFDTAHSNLLQFELQHTKQKSLQVALKENYI